MDQGSELHKVPVTARYYDNRAHSEDGPTCEDVPCLVSSDGEAVFIERPDDPDVWLAVDREHLLNAIERSEDAPLA